MSETRTDYEKEALESAKLLEGLLRDIGGPIYLCETRCLPCPTLEPWEDDDEPLRSECS